MKALKRPSEADDSLVTGAERPEELSEEGSVGNAAIAEEIKAAGSGEEENVGGIWDDIKSWWSTLWADDQEEVVAPDKEPEEVVEEVEEAVEEVEEQGDTTLAMRPANVKAGAVGALIGSGDTIDVHAEADAGSTVSNNVKNGKPVDVLEVSGTMIKVRFRVGKDAAEGWVAAALFSDQPGLGRDDANKDIQDDFTYELADPEQVTGPDMTGTDVSQGSLADCFFIAGMRATVTANASFFKDAITYNEKTGVYKVRFYEEAGYDWQKDETKYKEIYIEVDGYLPAREDGSEAYAEGAKDASKWGPIYEKAFAKWKGGYQVLDKGGNSGAAMEALTGKKSEYQSLSSMKEEEVIPWFTDAQAKGLAVITGSKESMQSEVQTPFSGSDKGPYTATATTINDRARIKPGTVKITDEEGAVGSMQDTGSQGSKDADIVGSDLNKGKITYASKQLSLEFNEGKGPADAKDLQLQFNYRGMIFTAGKVFAWHAYVFDSVKDGKIILKNPWGSWDPEPLSPADYLTYFSSLSTNQVPQLAETAS